MMAESNESHIAIRFGAAAKGPKGPPRHAPSSTLGKRPRHQFIHDDDSSGDESGNAQAENITHFGANGAEYVDEGRAHSDRDRAEQRKNARRRTESPASGGRTALEEKDEPQEEIIKWGLTIAKKPRPDQSKEGDVKEEATPRVPKTADEQAMDALLGKDSGIHPLHRTEDDAYRDAAATAPEVDDLATYNAIPVEGFGASLLMGQGWDGKMRGPKAKEITKRPNGMGLGAKKLKAEEELGGWDSKGKGGRNDKRPRLDEYRREKDKQRDRREDRYRDSYKNQRERERDPNRRYGDGDRNRDSDRDRNRDRDSHRPHNRERDRERDRDRDYRR